MPKFWVICHFKEENGKNLSLNFFVDSKRSFCCLLQWYWALKWLWLVCKIIWCLVLTLHTLVSRIFLNFSVFAKFCRRFEVLIENSALTLSLQCNIINNKNSYSVVLIMSYSLRYVINNWTNFIRIISAIVWSELPSVLHFLESESLRCSELNCHLKSRSVMASVWSRNLRWGGIFAQKVLAAGDCWWLAVQR